MGVKNNTFFFMSKQLYQWNRQSPTIQGIQKENLSREEKK